MQQAILTVDLGFGDAGKGSVVDYLTRHYNAHTVVRYNGGAQAAHRVLTNELIPRDHVFAQFGSGTLAGAATHLSRYMLLDPLAMVAEADHLVALGVADPFGRTTIAAGAVVITPFQRAVNRLREMARGDDRHGSCGIGIGETMADALAHGPAVVYAADLRSVDRLVEKLTFVQAVNVAKSVSLPAERLASDPAAAEAWDLLHAPDWRDWLIEAYRAFAAQSNIVGNAYINDLLGRPGCIIFEGAQGVLLDEWRGFHPHTTWSTTTLANAEALLREADYGGSVTRLGITRAYATRHGAGPFVSQDAALTAALPDAANRNGRWQGDFRVGWPDLVLLRYAADVVGTLDALAVTCIDRLRGIPTLAVCDAYRDHDSIVARLQPSADPHDLEYQARLTAQLNRSRPLLTAVDSLDALIDRIADAVGVPIGLLSYGPTADDKVATPHLARQTALTTAPL